MKIVMMLGMHLITWQALAQKPVFHALKDPKHHAGCYIEKGNNKTIANLSESDEEDNIALFNLTGKDEAFKAIKGTKYYPEAFANKRYRILIHQTFIKKEPNSCLEYYRFKIKVIYRGKNYFYQYKGFCGC